MKHVRTPYINSLMLQAAEVEEIHKSRTIKIIIVSSLPFLWYIPVFLKTLLVVVVNLENAGGSFSVLALVRALYVY